MQSQFFYSKYITFDYILTIQLFDRSQVSSELILLLKLEIILINSKYRFVIND